MAFLHRTRSRLLYFPLTPVSVRALLTTLQCSLHAMARQVAGPPGLVRPRGFLWPPRTCTPELARGRSPGPRVGYHYTAFLGEDCDRTSTGWSTAVTGCTLCCNVSFPAALGYWVVWWCFRSGYDRYLS